MKAFKRVFVIAMIVVMMLCLAACGESKPTIGIIQFGSHGSLNNCYDGVMQGLEEAGIDPDAYTVEYVNSNFDASVSQTQANNLVNKKAEVIIAIATPSAVAAATAADGDVPVVYHYYIERYHKTYYT